MQKFSTYKYLAKRLTKDDKMPEGSVTAPAKSKLRTVEAALQEAGLTIVKSKTESSSGYFALMVYIDMAPTNPVQNVGEFRDLLDRVKQVADTNGLKLLDAELDYAVKPIVVALREAVSKATGIPKPRSAPIDYVAIGSDHVVDLNRRLVYEDHNLNGLEVPSLYVDEPIAKRTETTTVTIAMTDPDVSEAQLDIEDRSRTPGKSPTSVWHSELTRRAIIKIYPSVGAANNGGGQVRDPAYDLVQPTP